MKLYYAPGACSLSPHIVAAEAGIALDYEKVDLKQHKTEKGEDYYRINPKGYVPALEVAPGEILTEGPAIVQYLADLKPQSGLIPSEGPAASNLARYRVLEWLVFINGEIHKSFGPLFGSADDDAKKAAREKIAKRFAYAGEKLGQQDYLTGASFTAADAYLYVMLRWATKNEIAMPANIAALRDRIAARPRVREVLAQEGLG